MAEILQELRVAQAGTQILFAFLLGVPFTQRFDTVTEFQRDVYYATLLCAAVAVALLIAPTAYHRVLFRQNEKAFVIASANRLTIGGLAFVALAMTGVVLLITDVLFSRTMTLVVTALTFLLFAVLWCLLPLARRARARAD